MTPSEAHKTISRFLPPGASPIVPDLSKCRGNMLYDSASGQELLDCFSYFGSNPLGYNHPALSEADFERKLLRVAKTKPSCSDFYTVEMAEFVNTFSRIAKCDPFKYLFFISGGALAVENALKTAFDWKHRKNLERGDKAALATDIIHFKEAFHGRTGYTLSLTNTKDPRKTQFFPKFDWPRIINPKLRFPRTEEEETRVELLEKQAIEEIKAAFKVRRNRIAAIIIEPVQAEGGDNYFRKEFHQALRQLADENEALLIYDEVQTGVGMTGKFWAYQHYGITPDVISFGKKTQVCGIMAGPRLDEVEGHVFAEESRINSTWGGNLVDMVRVERILRVIEEDKLVKNANDVGTYLLEEISRISANFSDVATNVRGLGLMVAFDLQSSEKRMEFLSRLKDNGVIALACGAVSVRLRPSLNFSCGDVDVVANAVKTTLSQIAG